MRHRAACYRAAAVVEQRHLVFWLGHTFSLPHLAIHKLATPSLHTFIWLAVLWRKHTVMCSVCTKIQPSSSSGWPPRILLIHVGIRACRRAYTHVHLPWHHRNVARAPLDFLNESGKQSSHGHWCNGNNGGYRHNYVSSMFNSDSFIYKTGTPCR
jgi:hypothetical protein